MQHLSYGREAALRFSRPSTHLGEDAVEMVLARQRSPVRQRLRNQGPLVPPGALHVQELFRLPLRPWRLPQPSIQMVAVPIPALPLAPHTHTLCDQRPPVAELGDETDEMPVL